MYRDLMNAEPLPEVLDYVLTIGVKKNSTRTTVMEDFQVLFNTKTEELVKFLFETLAFRIRLEAAKIENLTRPEKPEGARAAQESGDFDNQRRNDRF